MYSGEGGVSRCRRAHLQDGRLALRLCEVFRCEFYVLVLDSGRLARRWWCLLLLLLLSSSLSGSWKEKGNSTRRDGNRYVNVSKIKEQIGSVCVDRESIDFFPLFLFFSYGSRTSSGGIHDESFLERFRL